MSRAGTADMSCAATVDVAVARRWVRAVLWRPQRWPAALLAARRFARPMWWRHRPFLPRPDPCWWAMRSEVAYGDVDTLPDTEEIVAFVVWLGQMRRWARR